MAILQPSVPLTNTQVSLPRFCSFPSTRNTKSKYTDAIVPSLFSCRCVCVGLKLAFEVETNFANLCSFPPESSPHPAISLSRERKPHQKAR